MENQKFTPGPWTIENHKNEEKWFICAKNLTVDIATVHNTVHHINEDEANANAKLIAAAPDLLKSLNAIAVAGQLALHSGDNAKHGFVEMAIANALHAIKQATQP